MSTHAERLGAAEASLADASRTLDELMAKAEKKAEQKADQETEPTPPPRRQSRDDDFEDRPLLEDSW